MMRVWRVCGFPRHLHAAIPSPLMLVPFMLVIMPLVIMLTPINWR